ncbi:MAG: ATP-binding protein [Solirubrobacterales bacterium]|nr:ATP-binding protein [Solirubrobacterales bacterium]
MRTQPTETERVFDLPANAAAAGIARRELAATPGVAGDVAYKALLMTSEMIAVYVADLVPDPAARLRLSVRVTPAAVRIEVGGRPPEVPLDALMHSNETPSLGGMGLHIVERMADAWGVDGDGNSRMWFELARPGAAAA